MKYSEDKYPFIFTLSIFLAYLISLFPYSPIFAQQPQQPHTSSELRLLLKKLTVTGSVLYIAAHPDDENTRLLSYFANEKLYQANYLSLTRGDGGQNLIGSEQGDLLGIIRTQELMAARRIDRAHQFFTRAKDFGYSKTPQETISIWNKDSVLSDLVWIIRNTKPDLILCRFPPTSEGGHGHHTASAILAQLAFNASGDSTKFRWQLSEVKPWKAKRLLWNVFVRDNKADLTKFYSLDIGNFNPLLGKSYGELAAESRSMHRSQGFGSAKTRGTQTEYFKHMLGDSALSNTILESISSDIAAIPGSGDYIKAVTEATRLFSDEAPHLSVPALLIALKAADQIKDGYWKKVKKEEVSSLIGLCSGLWLEAISKNKYAPPGTEIAIGISAINRSPLSVKLEKIELCSFDSAINSELAFNRLLTINTRVTMPENTPFTSPFWLEQRGTKGLYKLENVRNVILPVNKPVSTTARFTLTVNGEKIEFDRPLVFKWTDPVEGEKYRALEVVPPLTVNFTGSSFLFRLSQSRQVKIELLAFVNHISGKLKLQIPEEWKCEPLFFKIDSLQSGIKKEFVFTVHAPQHVSDCVMQAAFEASGKTYSLSFTEVSYPHIPPQILLKKSEARFISVNYTIPPLRVGYIPGAGDEVASCIEQMGCEVIPLATSSLSETNLSVYDVIVTGVRAYNTLEELPDHYARLMGYIQRGGTLFVQYNTNNFLGSIKSSIGPFPFKISRDRVTDENSEVRFPDPAHHLLNFPNKISGSDFDGWIQERGLYFASEPDTNYHSVLSMNDTGEAPLEGALITARYGKGNFIYTGLAFFRQLPAGVPGAYRLFANLLSIGKE